MDSMYPPGMDQAFAPGAYDLLKGQGGLRAEILSDGHLSLLQFQRTGRFALSKRLCSEFIGTEAKANYNRQ